jgi:hypothetical protein
MLDRNGKTGGCTIQRGFCRGNIVVIDNDDFDAVPVSGWLVLYAVNQPAQQRISLPRAYSNHDMLFIVQHDRP